MDFWRTYTWKANFWNNTITASMDIGKIIRVFEASELNPLRFC